jgi:hypothetical protein
MDGFVFNSYKDQWVFASYKKTEGGMTLTAHPVQVFPTSDRNRLTNAIEQSLAVEPTVVADPDWNDPVFLKPPEAEVLGLRSWAAFQRHARCFHLERKAGGFLIEEWSRAGAGFVANPVVWRKQFPSGQLTNLIEHLLAVTVPRIATCGMTTPVAFGYNTGWMAVHSHDSREVSTALGLKATVKYDWPEGIDMACNTDRVFVTPPVGGWVLAVGSWMIGTGEPWSVQALAEIVAKLSNRFDEVQAFATQRVIEYHHWMRAVNGKLCRCFSWLGESGEVLANVGERTPAESKYPWDLLTTLQWAPTEQDVLNIAGTWSIDPSQLGLPLEVDEFGLLGKPSNLKRARPKKAPNNASAAIGSDRSP